MRVIRVVRDDWIEVEHDGTISWDELQEIKNDHWGEEAVAVEMYPPQSRVVNNANCRHLWRVSVGAEWPDIVKICFEGEDT